MKHIFSLLSFVLSVMGSSLVAASCAKEYDISTIDKTISAGGECFTIPLGSLDKIPLDSIINLKSLKNLVYDENGDITYRFSGDTTTKFTFGNLKTVLEAKPVFHSFEDIKITVNSLPDNIINSQEYPIKKTVTLYQPFSVDTKYTGLEDAGVSRLDSLVFSDYVLKLSGSILDSPVSKFPSGVTVSSELELPSRNLYTGSMIIGSSFIDKDTIKSDGSFSFGKASLAVSRCPAFGQEYDYHDLFRLKTVSITIPDAATYKILNGKTLTFQVVLTESSSASDPPKSSYPQKVYGLFGKEIGAAELLFSNLIDNETLKNSRFTFNNPYVLLGVKTNSTTTVSLGMGFTSFYGETPFTPPVADFSLIPSQQPTETSESFLWVGEKQPAGSGFEYYEYPISPILTRCFDSLKVSFIPRVVPEKETGRNQVIWPESEMSLLLDFSLHAPLRFSEGLCVSFHDTIKNISPVIKNVFEKNHVFLVANLETTYPLDIEVWFKMLDEEGKDMGVSSSKAVFPSADFKGVPKNAVCECELNPFASAQNLGSIEVIYTFMAGSDKNMIINRYNSVKMDLKVSVPGGITYDLDKM